MSERMRITIARNGPYLVSGRVPVAVAKIETNGRGESIRWGEGAEFPVSEKCALCRCGESKNKPFCDGTHCTNGFSDGL